MELGNGKLPRTGLNSLNQAVHPTQGLAWTDGNRVVLTDLQVHSGEAKFGDSQVIGSFDSVRGVFWAPVSTVRMPALLAIQHRTLVSVWQLCPDTAGGPSKWQVSQASEIRESLPILPQGCVWHPQDAVLTVLTAQDVSIFPNVHRDGSRVKVDITVKGRVYCACWTPDGQRLVLAVDSSLHSYIWDSSQKSLHSCSFCPVFPVNCSIRSITAIGNSQVAIATELPLDKLCSLNASEAFDGSPDGGSPAGDDGAVHTHPVGETPPADEQVAATDMNSAATVSPFSVPLDLTHIHFNPSRAEQSSLICLRKKDYLTGTGQDSSHLILVTFKKSITMTEKVAIPGILVPDLIAFNMTAQLVAVASNTCNVILIYLVAPSSIPNIQQIQLESNERPKGICFLTDRLLLIAVGEQKPTETAFLPSSESDQYTVRLIVREITLGRESSGTSAESQGAFSDFSALLNKADREEKFTDSLSPGSSPLSQGLLLTANSSTLSGRSGRALIQEIKSPLSPLSSDSIVHETLHRPSWLCTPLPRHSRTPEHTSTPELNSPQRENFKKEKETCPLSRELEILSRRLVGMQECLIELMDFLHKEKQVSPAYPPSQDPPYVHLILQPCSVGPAERRAVLLCDGKLRLSTVQQMFGLHLVEMLHDSHWILLSADSQDFIPLTFTAAQTVVVRDGSLSEPEGARGPLSHSQDPDPPPEVFGDLWKRLAASTA
ncbi:WD repeat and coiled-coil-containing protein isoform X2 [Apodemus sylvaticus]|uniref:WD repeat and coiled-coil-containing protein isoform X2 n=1 Tax=Apodemus sylvaticus TaxID=10129 RepID=UPI0022432CB7|nr:WD repeat and coiled-coil-containing protein isoform X2 [Apodemus sylvaticus]